MLAVIWDLVSVKMIAPCLIHPSFISQNRRGRGVKEPTQLFEKSRGTFPGGVVFLSRISRHSYNGLSVGYNKLIMVSAASDALYAEGWSPSLLLTCEYVKGRGEVGLVVL